MTRTFPPIAPRSSRQRAGISLVEIMVALVVLGVVLAMAGRLTFAVTQFGRLNDLKTKRGFAMQQQMNYIGALPYVSLNTTTLPAAKSFIAGDFRYTRRVALTTAGSVTRIAITIVPNTGISRDTLQKESTTLVRTVPPCGTVLNVGAC